MKFYKGWDYIWPAVMEAAALTLQDSDPEISKGLLGGTAAQAFRMLYGKSAESRSIQDVDAAFLKKAVDTPMILISSGGSELS